MTMQTQEERTIPEKRQTPLQTLQRAYQQICAGKEPWIPLGNFMHHFFGCYRERRFELLADPIMEPEEPTDEQWKWAVFCAASAEYLSKKYDVPCPLWALQARYQLAEPWYDDLCADLEEVQEELRETTPEAFAKRNIFCGDTVFNNKYEKPERYRHTA
jgi:hypothetical protein